MKTSTLARLGLAACALSAMTLFRCTEEGPATGGMDLAMNSEDMAMSPNGDLSTGNPDIAGTMAPVKVMGFTQPASAVWDATTNAWYVSNVITANVGDPRTFADNNAAITKVPANLMNPDHNWFKGTATVKLSAPFGMRIAGGKLYTGDVNKVWSIDIANPMGAGTIQSGTVAAGGLAGLAGYPAFLIDVALDASNNVYVVDATGGRLLKFTAPFTAGAMPTAIVAADTLAGASGVFVDGNKVVMAEAGINMIVMKNGGISTCNLDGTGLARLYNSPKNSLAYQGIEKDGSNYLLASPGDKIVYNLNATVAQPTPSTLRNVALDGATTATDIGWDPASRTLAVPDTGANVVYFYKIP